MSRPIGRVVTFDLHLPFVSMKLHVMDAKTARVRAHVRAQVTTDTAETVQNVAAAVSDILDRMHGGTAGAGAGTPTAKPAATT